MSMHPAIIVGTTVVNEIAKTTNTILAHKQAMCAIDAQLTVAKMSHTQALAEMKAESKQAKQALKTHQHAYQMHFNATEMDKEEFRKLHKQAVKRAMQAPSHEEYQRLMGIAESLQMQMKELRDEQWDNYRQFSDNVHRTHHRRSDRGFKGQIVDADFDEK